MLQLIAAWLQRQCEVYPKLLGQSPGADTVMPMNTWFVIGRGGVILQAEECLHFAYTDSMR